VNNKGEGMKSNGIGFFGLLTIVFIVLKLTGYVSWPWVWVLAPMWISLLLVLIIIVIFFIIKCRE
jgi:uncharacterized protein (DUF983 family)